MKLYLLFLSLFGFQAFTQSNEFSIQYTSIYLPRCTDYQENHIGSSANCSGPKGTTLRINSGDWANMEIVHNGRTFEAWDQISKVGSRTSLGGRDLVVEWVLKDSNVHSLIVRVSATNPETHENLSTLLVFGFKRDSVCFRGQAPIQFTARSIAESNACVQTLKTHVRSQPTTKPEPQQKELTTQTFDAHIQSIELADDKKVVTADSTSSIIVRRLPWKFFATGLPERYY